MLVPPLPEGPEGESPTLRRQHLSFRCNVIVQVSFNKKQTYPNALVQAGMRQGITYLHLFHHNKMVLECIDIRPKIMSSTEPDSTGFSILYKGRQLKFLQDDDDHPLDAFKRMLMEWNSSKPSSTTLISTSSTPIKPSFTRQPTPPITPQSRRPMPDMMKMMVQSRKKSSIIPGGYTPMNSLSGKRIRIDKENASPVTSKYFDTPQHSSSPPLLLLSQSTTTTPEPLKVASSQFCSNEPSVDVKKSPLKKEHEGFQNMGQTCYMGSVLQLLLASGSFVQDVVELKECIPSDAEIIQESIDLFQLKQTQKIVCPSGLKEALSKISARYASKEQQDAQEFYTEYMEQVHLEMSRWNHPNVVCPVEKNVQLVLQQSLECTQCHFTSTHDQVCRDLSLHFPSATIQTWELQDLLDAFFKEERVEYTCDKCHCKEAIKSHKMKHLPRVLIIHLQRFLPCQGGYSKRKDPVSLPPILNLNDSTKNNNTSYHLTAIVNHFGSSSSRGHYVCDVKQDHEWKCFNDSIVTLESEDIVEKRQKTAYLMAFVRE